MSPVFAARGVSQWGGASRRGSVALGRDQASGRGPLAEPLAGAPEGRRSRPSAERRLADDAEALGFREVDAFGGRSQHGVQRPGELNVERVPRLAGADMAGKRAAQEREVSDEVQDLVPHELVAEAQGPGNDAALVEDDRVVKAASTRQPASAHRLDVAGETKGPGRRDTRCVLLRADRHRQALAADDRVRKIDLVGNGQSGPVRLERHAAVAANDLDRAREREGAHPRRLSLEAGGVEEAHEGERRAIQDRDLRSFDLDQAVVQALAGRRGKRVLHRPDGDTARGNRRGIVEGRCGCEPRGNSRPGMIESHEDESMVRWGRSEMRAHGMAGMKSDPLDRNCGAQSRLRSQPVRLYRSFGAMPRQGGECAPSHLFLKSYRDPVSRGVLRRRGTDATPSWRGSHVPAPVAARVVSRSKGRRRAPRERSACAVSGWRSRPHPAEPPAGAPEAQMPRRRGATVNCSLMPKKQPLAAMGASEIKTVATNRKAFHDFFIEDRAEAGLVLTGTEVKSLREGRAQLKDSYIAFRDGEAFLVGAHISPYGAGSWTNHIPERERKLLLHRRA